jgi:DMSO reductase family type II enzyme chaperone
MDRIDESLARCAVWSLLADAFRRPEKAAHSVPDRASAVAAATALGLDARPLAAAERSADDLASAYDALFGHTVRGPCPAYEGEYGEPRGMRFSHEIADIEGYFRAFGVRTGRSAAERPDHVSVECEFLAFLALKEAHAAVSRGEETADLCRDATRRFLAEHLGRFAPALAARVRRRAKEPFFVAAADLLEAMLRRDAAAFGVPLGAADLGLRADAGTPDDACVACGRAEETPR